MASHTVTVFGGSGFLGRHLVRRLAAKGWRVRVAVRDPEDALFLKPLGNPGQIVAVACSTADANRVAEAVSDAEAVVNLVGILFEKGRRTFEAVHVAGAQTIARAAKAAGAKRLVHVSALGADDRSPSAYARTKGEGEKAVRAAFAEAVVLRPSVVFGPEDDFFNRFAAMATISPALPVIGCPAFPRISFADGPTVDFYGPGGARLQPVYVGDVADAIMAGIERTDVRGKTYELAGPESDSFKGWMERMLKIIRRERVLVPVPFAAAELMALFVEWLPTPPLTVDQVTLLRRDNVATGDLPGLEALGIHPTPAGAVMEKYLARFRPPSRQMARE